MGELGLLWVLRGQHWIDAGNLRADGHAESCELGSGRGGRIAILEKVTESTGLRTAS